MCMKKLFFDVRNRLDKLNWITDVIISSPDDLCFSRTGQPTDDQKGFVFRLLAYYGGPLVLESVLAGPPPGTLPRCIEDCPAWFNENLSQLAHSRTASELSMLVMNREDVIRLLIIGLTLKPRNQLPKIRGEKRSQASP